MSNPTLVCEQANSYLGAAPGGVTPFNQVQLFLDTGVLIFTIECDPVNGGFLPPSPSALNMTASDYSDLFPGLLLIFAVAFGVRVLRKMMF